MAEVTELHAMENRRGKVQGKNSEIWSQLAVVYVLEC